MGGNDDEGGSYLSGQESPRSLDRPDRNDQVHPIGQGSKREPDLATDRLLLAGRLAYCHEGTKEKAVVTALSSTKRHGIIRWPLRRCLLTTSDGRTAWNE